MSQAERFFALFKSGKQGFTKWNPKTGVPYTCRDEPTVDDIEKHLRGDQYGVGLVPIDSNGLCFWGAIDVDHHDGSQADLPALETAINKLSDPLIVCRTKRGGAHIYAFFSEPVKAGIAQVYLRMRARDLGLPETAGNVEIFPKQVVLHKDQIGNALNMPYFQADETARYCFAGKRLSLDEFLDHASQCKIDSEQILRVVFGDFKDAPPCIKKMMIDGVSRGTRNNALYNVGVFLKRAFGREAKNLGRQFNQLYFDDPLTDDEAERVLRSATKREYTYKCHDEPACSLCDKDACKACKYGITPNDDDDDIESLPVKVEELCQIATSPVCYSLKVNGFKIEGLTTDQLFTPDIVMSRYFDLSLDDKPKIKPAKWHNVIKYLAKDARRISAPDDSSPQGQIRHRFFEFIQGLNGACDANNLFLGMPITIKHNGTTHVAFRGVDFHKYLKRSKGEDVKGVKVFQAVQSLGVFHETIDADGKACDVWMIAQSSIPDLKPAMVKIETEY